MKTSRLSLLAGLAAVPSLRAPSLATEKTIELPPETGTYREAPGVDKATTHCMTCHSVEYTSTQPPMGRKFWEAEVVKMREKYAAPIPESEIAALADYLTAAYGVPAPADAKPVK